MFTAAPPAVVVQQVGATWADVQAAGSQDPGGTTSSSQFSYSSTSPDGTQTTSETQTSDTTYNNTMQTVTVNSGGMMYQYQVETGWFQETHTVTDVTTTITTVNPDGSAVNSTVTDHTDIDVTRRADLTVNPPSVAFSLTLSGTHRLNANQTATGDVSETATGTSTDAWSFSASGQIGGGTSYTFNDASSTSLSDQQTQGTAGQAGSASLSSQSGNTSSYQASGSDPGQSPATYSLQDTATDTVTSTMAYGGGSSDGSITFAFNTNLTNSDSVTVSDSSGGNTSLSGGGSETYGVNGAVNGFGTSVPLSDSTTAGWSLPSGTGPIPTAAGPLAAVGLVGGGMDLDTLMRMRVQGMPAVPFRPTDTGAPNVDAINAYFNWLAAQWNAFEIGWPFAGNPPAVGGPLPPPTLPGLFIVQPKTINPAFGPHGFGNWPWNAADWFSGIVLIPYDNGPADHGFTWTSYRLGIQTGVGRVKTQ